MSILFPGPLRGSSLLANEVLLPLGFPPEKLPAVRALLAELKRDVAPSTASSSTEPEAEAVDG